MKLKEGVHTPGAAWAMGVVGKVSDYVNGCAVLSIRPLKRRHRVHKSAKFTQIEVFPANLLSTPKFAHH